MTTAAEAVSQLSAKNPYKFLEYFVEEDQPNFAGRDREIREVVTGILRGPTFVLYGRSGLGKTSLLQAGIFPELRKRKHRPIYVRTLISPISDLCEAVAAEFQKPPVTSLEGLRSLLKAAPADETVVLVLDQFEEFFIRFYKKRNEREDFIRAIETILKDNALRVRVIFSLREDYLAQMEDFYGHLPSLFENDYRLLPLSAYGTRRAVSQPLINTEIKYEQKLVVSIVDQLDELRFDPPLLQVICTEIYREAVKRNHDNIELKFEDLQKVGGLDGIFRRYLNAFIEEVPSESHLVARMILDALITQENTKQAITLSFFRQAGFTASEKEITTILELLVDHGLVRRDRKGNDNWYELLHERLVAMILEWLDLDQEFFKFRFARDLIANCSKGEVFRENHGLLLNEGQIKGVVGPYRDHLKLNPLDKEFIARSVIYRNTPAADMSEDVEFWCGRFGADQSFDLILTFFDDSDEAARLGAASSAILVPDKEGKLSSKCLDLALKDPSNKVRRAAGRSFVKLADDQQLKSLRDALNEKETRHHARGVLADMHQSGRSMASFNWLWRRRGKGTAEKRALKKHRNDIYERGKVGALTGLLAGMAWAFTVGLGLTCLIMWALAAGDEWKTVLSISMSTMLPVSLGLGALCGYSYARKAAKTAALGVEGQWFRVIAKPGVYFWILTCMLSLIGLTILDEHGVGNHLRVVWMILLRIILAALTSAAVLALFYALIAGLLRAIRDCVSPGAHKYYIWAWAFIFSIGIPFFVSAVMFTVQSYWLAKLTNSDDLRRAVSFLAVYGAPLFSFLAFTISVSLATSAGKIPIGRVKVTINKRRWVARTITMLACLGFATWFGLMYGFDTIPFPPFARAIEPLPSQTIKLASKLGPGVPDTDYYSIPYIKEYKVIKIANENIDVSVSLHGKSLKYYNNEEILLGLGLHNLALKYDGPIENLETVINPVSPDVSFTLYRVRNLRESISVDDVNTYYIKKCVMTKNAGADPAVWKGNIQSKVDKSSGEDDLRVSVFVPTKQQEIRANGSGDGRIGITIGSSATYEGDSGLDLSLIRDTRQICLINQSVGKIKPDPSGSWNLELTFEEAEDTELQSCTLIVLFKLEH